MLHASTPCSKAQEASVGSLTGGICYNEMKHRGDHKVDCSDEPTTKRESKRPWIAHASLKVKQACAVWFAQDAAESLDRGALRLANLNVTGRAASLLSNLLEPLLPAIWQAFGALHSLKFVITTLVGSSSHVFVDLAPRAAHRPLPSFNQQR